MSDLHTDAGYLADIRSDDFQRQYEGLEELTSSSLDAAEVRELLPELLALIGGQNSLLRRKAEGCLVDIARDRPEVVGRAAAESSQVLTDLLDEAGTETRAVLVRALGASGRSSVVEELDDRYDTEVSPVRQAIEDGLEAAVESLIEDLETRDVDAGSDPARALWSLARNRPGYLVDREKELDDLLEGPNGDIIGDAFVWILKTEARDDLSESILTEAIQVERDASDGRVVAAVNAVDTMLRGDLRVDAVEEQVVGYVGWLTDDDSSVQRDGLRLLMPVAEHRPDLLTGSKEPVARIATGEGEPAALATDMIITHAASSADDRGSYLQTLLSQTAGQAAFTWLSTTLDVLRHRGDDRWRKVDTGILGGSCVRGLHRATAEGSTIPVFWPAFEPRMIVMGAIEVLLDGLSDGTDVVLYTKGTSTQWGGKTDVREEYSRYGIEIPEGLREGAGSVIVALDEILPHGYVYEGERGLKGKEAGPSTLILVSRGSELEPVMDVGPTLFNFHSRVTEEDEGLVDDTIDADPSRLICPMYSLYTKHEHGGNRVPEYGPPDLSGADVLPDIRAIRDVLDSGGDLQQDGPALLEGDRILGTLGRPRSIEIEAVDGEPIRDHLTEGYEAAMDLLDFDAEHAGWRSFSYLQRFERLPVPADHHDRWILDKRRSGERGRRSWTMEEFIEEFGRFVTQVDMFGRAGTSDVHEQLEYLLRELERMNPLYEELCSRVSAAIEEQRSIVIYTPLPSWRRMLEERLLADQVLYEYGFRPERVRIADRDSIRAIDSCEELIIAGPQRSQETGYHAHPAADEITILTYDGRWRMMIARRLDRFVDRVNGALQAADTEPIPTPNVSVTRGTIFDAPDEDQEASVGSTDDEDPFVSGSTAKAVGLQERFAETLDDSRLDTEYAYDQERYDDLTHREFEIHSQTGVTLHRESGSRVLVEERQAHPDGVETDYEWVSPGELPSDATILVIESGFWRRLWDEWLDEQYSDLEGGDVTDQLRTWYTALTEIMEEVQTETEADSPVSSEVLDHIVAEARKVGIERGKNRIHDWFESVHAAESALDLARDPGLTMGPGDGKDIERIGEAFDRSELTGRQGILVDTGLRKIRGAHIHEGHEIREDVESTLTDGGKEADRILEHATWYEVERVVEVTDHDGADGPDDDT